jgi:uncharacterized membrane protein
MSLTMQPTKSPFPRHVVDRWISHILRFGVWGSAGLMVAGLLVHWLSRTAAPPPAENPTPGEILRRLFSSSIDDATLMYAGLVLLMLTPVLRVFTSVVAFSVERDRRFVVVSLVVLGMLLAEFFFSLRVAA